MNEFKALRKRLDTEPTTAISALQADVDDASIRLDLGDAGDRLAQLVEDRSALVEQRGARSAAIGKLKRSGQPVDQEIAAVAALSAELKQLQAQVDEQLDRVLRLVASTDASAQSQAGAAKRGLAEECMASGNQDADAPAVDQAAPAGPGQFRNPAESATAVGTSSIARLDATGPSAQASRDAWNRYVAGHPAATHYHQYDWRPLIESSLGARTVYLMARDVDGRVVGVLSAVMMKSRLFGSFLLSMPFLIYGGPLADTAQVSEALSNHLCELASEEGATRIELRETRPRAGWQAMTEKVSMILALPGGGVEGPAEGLAEGLAERLAELDAGLGAKLRSQVRRASREPVTFELGGLELVDEFYRVFSEKMRDLGTPVYPRAFFEAILRSFSDSARIAMVKREEEAVAAALIIRYRDTLEVPWAASRRKHDASSVNMYLYHQLLQTAQREGCRYFDFGRSTRDGPTFRFKRQWGAKPFTLHWHSSAAPGHELPCDSGTGSAMKQAVRVWQHLPLPVANALGPLIAVKLPW